MGMSPDDIRAIQQKYPKLSTVQIYKATKTGEFRGSNDFAHLVQTVVVCSDGKASTEKNRFGGKEAVKIKFQ
jgi:predicted ATP-dependent serine protease